jgi:hypothetical protein
MTMTPLLILVALLAIWCGACAALGYSLRSARNGMRLES